MNKIALLLSGLGYEKGSSVFELPFVLRTLEKRGMIPQPSVPSKSFNEREHLLGAPDIQQELKILFSEKVYTYEELSPQALDGAIVFGGRGAMTVLSNYADKAENAQCNPEFTDFIRALRLRNKPIGSLGYGAIPIVLGLRKIAKPIITCGGDPQVQDVLEHLGAIVVNTTADNVVIDEQNRIYSSHGIIPSTSIYRASQGIEQVIDALVDSILEDKGA